jgi:hypothetical protein
MKRGAARSRAYTLTLNPSGTFGSANPAGLVSKDDPKSIVSLLSTLLKFRANNIKSTPEMPNTINLIVAFLDI